jgi:hypothetical protein
MMKKLVFGILCAFALLSPAAAHATIGYVCTLYHAPGTGTYGDNGYVRVHYYSQPNCAGSFQGSRSYCSVNSSTSNPACSTGPTWKYGKEDLNGLATRLFTAASQGTKVDHIDSSACHLGGTGCAAYVYLYGTP